ncbi:MAG: hypothetical protein ACRD0K_22225 [Egibacteraceae bacterium]
MKLDLTLLSSRRASCSDAQALSPPRAEPLGILPGAVERPIGTIDPARTVAAQGAYIGAFFDQYEYLRGGRPDPPLDGPVCGLPVNHVRDLTLLVEAGRILGSLVCGCL